MVLGSLLPWGFRRGAGKTSSRFKMSSPDERQRCRGLQGGQEASAESERGSCSGLAVSVLLLGLRPLEKAPRHVSRFSKGQGHPGKPWQGLGHALFSLE